MTRALPRPGGRALHGGLWLVALIGLLVAAVGCTEDRSDELRATAGPPASARAGCTAADLLGCARTSTIKPLVPDSPVAATGTPITIGMINQENTPVGSFPELSQAVQAAVEFVNNELGGIDGHPIRLEVCNTKFSAEGSTACAQQFICLLYTSPSPRD